MIKVGIDATPVLVEQQTGIEHYASALVREIARFNDQVNDLAITFYLHSGNPFASSKKVANIVEMLEKSGNNYQIYAARRGYGFALSYYALRDRLTLIHMLRVARPALSNCPYLLTFHDVRHVGLTYEEREIERANFTNDQRAAIERASGIIFVSDSTKMDLVESLGHKIGASSRIIYHGVDEGFFHKNKSNSSFLQDFGLEKYILFVGTIQYRKNLSRLVEAYAMLKEIKDIPHKLVLAGRNGWGAEQVFDKVNELGLQKDVIFPGYIDEDDLPSLYAHAEVYAYPSLHEGFGIPILEAMASGTIVVTSNIYSMPEVAGDAAIYVDPRDTDDLAAGLWRAISDRELRIQLVNIGKNRAKKFTWKMNAQSTLDFYREILIDVAEKK